MRASVNLCVGLVGEPQATAAPAIFRKVDVVEQQPGIESGDVRKDVGGGDFSATYNWVEQPLSLRYGVTCAGHAKIHVTASNFIPDMGTSALSSSGEIR